MTHTVRTSPVLLIALSLSSTLLHAQGPSCDTSHNTVFAIRESTRRNLWKLFEKAGLVGRYDIDLCHLNPFYLSGDFDGDGRVDFVVRLRKATGVDSGQLAVLRGNGAVAWLTRDTLLRYPGPGAWYVHPRSEPVGQGVEERKPPLLRGDAIMMIMPETSSALVYWNGRRFVSYWQGD
jgi:hypothetical protein